MWKVPKYLYDKSKWTPDEHWERYRKMMKNQNPKCPVSKPHIWPKATAAPTLKSYSARYPWTSS